MKISLTSAAERIPNPNFSIADPDHPQQPQYDTVEVWDITEGTETNKAKLVWKMVAEPFGNQKGVARLSYGVKLDGFKFATEPVQLEKGHQYRIRVAGIAEGNFRFRINPDGNVDGI